MINLEKEKEVRIEQRSEKSESEESSFIVSESQEDGKDLEDSDEEGKRSGNKTLYVKGFGNNWEVKDLTQIFSRFGTITNLVIKKCDWE